MQPPSGPRLTPRQRAELQAEVAATSGLGAVTLFDDLKAEQQEAARRELEQLQRGVRAHAMVCGTGLCFVLSLGLVGFGVDGWVNVWDKAGEEGLLQVLKSENKGPEAVCVPLA
eukprot:1156235-Pelagomonas_calceolata.AAC.14